MDKIDVGTKLEFKKHLWDSKRIANRIDTDGTEYTVTNIEYREGNAAAMLLQSKKTGKGIRFTLVEVFGLFKIKR
jgi:hypothetical protein